MPSVIGPDTRVRSGVGDIQVWKNVSEEFCGSTLGEVLAAYSAKYGSTLELYDGSHPDHPFANDEPAKYFWYTGKSAVTARGGIDQVRYPLDVHILRGDEVICPKQDLSIEIWPDDVIEIGVQRGC